MKSIALIALILGLSVLAWGQSLENVISVTGSATIKLTPDIIRLRIAINEKAKDRLVLNQKESKMIEKLTQIGIGSSQLTVLELASNFVNRVFSKDDIVLSKNYILQVSDAKTANAVLNALQDVGLSNVTIETVTHTKLSEYKREALAEAIRQAKEKADLLATTIGQKAGPAVAITEHLQTIVTSNLLSNAMYSSKVSATYDTSTDLDFDELSIRAEVDAKFKIL